MQLTSGHYDPATNQVTVTVTSTIPTANLTATLRAGGHNATSFPMESDLTDNYSFAGAPDYNPLPVTVISDHGGFLTFTG